jgi:hypothetical protein
MKKQYPKPNKGTEVRIVGPNQRNGMNTWRVYKVLGETQFQQIGPECFSIEQAEQIAKDIILNKQVFWIGHQSFIKKPIL